MMVAPAGHSGEAPTVMRFYSGRPDGFDQTSVEAAQAFAAPVTVALQASDRTEQPAVASREIIGQAKAILMERHGLPADEAFRRLLRCFNVRLADVAAWLVHEGAPRGAGCESRPEPPRPPQPVPEREAG